MIIVTGSGRSGTSITTKLLQYAGADFPNSSDWEDEVRAGIENHDVVTINKMIFSVNNKNDYYGYDWLLRAEEQRSVDLLQFIIQKFSSDWFGKFVKDPLFSKTLNVWARTDSKIEHVVICVRDVWAVVDSALETGRGFSTTKPMTQELITQEINARLGYLFRHLIYNSIPYTIVRYEHFEEDVEKLLTVLKLDVGKGKEFINKEFKQIQR